MIHTIEVLSWLVGRSRVPATNKKVSIGVYTTNMKCMPIGTKMIILWRQIY